MHDRFLFRNIHVDETEQAIAIEQICFPPHEACAPQTMIERVNHISDMFLVVIDQETGKIAGFLNGIATQEQVFRDEFFLDIQLHNKDGKNVMILGLDVLPEYRNQGLARQLVCEYCRREKEKGRENLFLTCLEQKVAMYLKFGFIDQGIANSSWGGEEWHEMRYVL